MTFPSTVGTVRSNAFSGCTGLTSARFLGNAPEAGDTIFGEREESFTVYRPAEAQEWPEPGALWHEYRTAIFED